MSLLLPGAAGFAVVILSLPGLANSQTLSQALAAEDPSALLRDVARRGDPIRGARVFYRPSLGCAGCHVAGAEGQRLGPDLAREAKGHAPAELVESILSPSKVVTRGYETVTLALADGKTFSGPLAEERPDALVVRDPSQSGRPVVIKKADIEERRDGGPSVMPAGLANTLAGREEFLDLAKYVTEVVAHGPSRALELRPTAAELVPPPLPAYESDLAHAELIAGLDAAALERGRAVYDRVCVTCHGTAETPGSLPTSLRFASGTFKNGADPHAMYRTLTHGYGQMAAQPWMTPGQKYDVIHYVRETFLRARNPSQYVAVTPAYLAALPRGSSRGPESVNSEPWTLTDYGPTLMLTMEVGNDSPLPNIAYKGVAVRLDHGPGGVARGRRWVIYDHDTMRLAGAWSGEGFIDWRGINWNGEHEAHPRAAGTVRLKGPAGPAWADPATGLFDDPRVRGRDGRPYGPLPREWLHYRGLFHNGDRAILAYSVGDAPVLESPQAIASADGVPIFVRTLNVGKSSNDLILSVEGGGAALVSDGPKVETVDGRRVVRVPASKTPARFRVFQGDVDPSVLRTAADKATPADDLEPLTHGGPKHWAGTFATRPAVGAADGPFASDVLTTPDANPWNCRFRVGGLDFFEGGSRAAVCTWDGDVWYVDGVNTPNGPLTWTRVASGLFQPLGLKIVDGSVFVSCRDQIVALRDLNADGETDYYESFNSDHQVTEHFHEFAMDLQTDPAGNFYYTKAARHAKTAVVPQHGTLLEVSRDGSKTEILATGFRAPNGVWLEPDGSFFLSDQEGHWTPKNRINRVVRGGFYGNMFGYHDVSDPSDAAMSPPVCWITNAFDRSPAELLRVTSPSWGPLQGSLISLSYGYGKVFVVPYETVDGQAQGGLCELPIPAFPTGVIRARFNPADGHLYLGGLYSWAGNQTAPGGLYRVRATGRPQHLPVGLHARKDSLELTFTEPIDPSTVSDLARYAVRTWSLRRTANYGSAHHDETPKAVTAATLSAGGKTLSLTVPGLAPAMGMQVVYSLRGADGAAVDGRIHNTIHKLGD